MINNLSLRCHRRCRELASMCFKSSTLTDPLHITIRLQTTTTNQPPHDGRDISLFVSCWLRVSKPAIRKFE
ncbi:hypothetical protein QQG55_38860 [Brugia pahangi]